MQSVILLAGLLRLGGCAGVGAALLLLAATGGAASKPSAVLVGPAEPVAAGARLSVWLHHLNGSGILVTQWFAPRLRARLTQGARTLDRTLELRQPSEAGEVTIPPGGFVRREYTLEVPTELHAQVVLEVPELPSNRVVFDVRPADALAAPPERPPKTGLARIVQEAEPRNEDYQPGQFFKDHIFGHDPMYFIAGSESPNAKFQLSLRYQLLSRDGPAARRLPMVKGVNLAYTQTSLWDLSAPSSPFLDSSYKPELLYRWDHVEGGRWADWFRLDLQGGFQHESNGKGGADSRSLNVVYLQPTMTFGRAESLQLALGPRVWAYVSDLSDNPDLKDYRGYGELRASLGWMRGLQLATVGRLGDDGNRGSLELDLTYPMMKLLWGNFSFYLYVQYFTGYGESLLLYNQRSEAVRFGFALFR
jgi:outer membrane phospholipase A